MPFGLSALTASSHGKIWDSILDYSPRIWDILRCDWEEEFDLLRSGNLLVGEVEHTGGVS